MSEPHVPDATMSPRPPNDDPCRGFDELIEPYVDDALEDTERARLARHLLKCPRCRAGVELARAIHDGLNDLPLLRCPPAVTAAVFARTGVADGTTRRWGRTRTAPRWLPVLAAAAAAIAVLGLGWTAVRAPTRTADPEIARLEASAGTENGTENVASAGAANGTAPGTPNVASAGTATSASTGTANGADPASDPQAVAQAEADVKLALAYLGRIGERTGSIVRDDVIEQRVASPVLRSVRRALAPHEKEG